MHIPSLKKNAILNAIRTLLSILFPLITFPYASRILLPEGIGRVSFARSIIAYFGLLAGLGIHIYGGREAAKIRDDKYLLSKISKEILSINLISTVISYILFGIALFVVPKFEEYRALLCIIGSTILFTTMGMGWLYSAVEDYGYITARSILFHIISLILLFLFVHSKDDYLKYATISVISSVGSNICNLVHSKKYIDLSMVHSLDFKKHLKPVFTIFAMACVIEVYVVLDTTMLGFLCGEWQVGIYTAATKINRIILSLIVSVSSVLLPRLSYYLHNDNNKRFEELTYKGFDFLLLTSIPCCIGLCIVGSHVVLLLAGEAYKEAIPVMRIMNPIIIIVGLSNFIGMQLFMPMRKERYTLYSVICGAATNFMLNIVLIPKLQAMGAAIATVCAETAVTTVQFYLARKMIQIKIIIKMFLVYLFNTIIMSLVVIIIAVNINNNFYNILCCVLTGASVYSVLLYLEKNKIMTTVINSLRSRFI